jgi:hypothetical protein
LALSLFVPKADNAVAHNGRGEAMDKTKSPNSWVIYQTVRQGVVSGVNGLCQQNEWEKMERSNPGAQVLIQGGIASEGEAERLARGASGDTKPRVTRDSTN